MRSFLALIGTYILVYFAVPWLTILLVDWLPIADWFPVAHHLQTIRTITALLSSVLVYAFLRRRFGDKVPPV